ncbi:hypothetical protein [Micromonospora sp. HK10]|uniref:hypothetical protein n=1 Tax=Micromonospora sp. HK10 TaxID=1538294 RepID=UPI000627147A|nr:hypothetical protein [Micromonospora sp. HK10]KKK04988.1 hypothetical protein LQ51_16520 [Micromonospora sp. HK10]
MNDTRPYRRLAVLALATLPLLAGAGCDGSGSAPRSAPPATEQPAGAGTPAAATEEAAPSPAAAVDACALVSKAEAERLAGTALEDAKPVQDSCTYSGPVTGPTAQVEVYVGDGAKKYLDIERDLGHELRPLSGVGDEAYATGEAVFVNKSGRWVTVRLVRLNDPAENRKPLETVARTVAGRL